MRANRLSWHQAQELRQKHLHGLSQGALATEYGISQSAVSATLRFKNHKFEPPPKKTREELLLIRRKQRRLSSYKLTQNQIDALGNVCHICGTDKDSRWDVLNIDHNHMTGKVRGLLCSKCNKGIGLFNDSSELLLKAFEYLNKTK